MTGVIPGLGQRLEIRSAGRLPETGRRFLAERLVGPPEIVQHDNRTPTEPKSASFFIHGIPGLDVWFAFMG